MNKSPVKQNIIQPSSFSCLLRTQKFAAQEIIIPRASSSGKQSEDRSDYGRLSLIRSPTNVRDNTPLISIGVPLQLCHARQETSPLPCRFPPSSGRSQLGILTTIRTFVAR